MNEAINLEVRFFLTSVMWGAILFTLYDILRIIRRVIRHSEVIVAIQDIFYWVISSVLIFRMMYQLNDGIIRGFSVLGITIGMTLYKYILSEWVVNGISFLLNTIISWIKNLIIFFMRPFKFGLRLLKKRVLKATTQLKRWKNSWLNHLHNIRKKGKIKKEAKLKSRDEKKQRIQLQKQLEQEQKEREKEQQRKKQHQKQEQKLKAEQEQREDKKRKAQP